MKISQEIKDQYKIFDPEADLFFRDFDEPEGAKILEIEAEQNREIRETIGLQKQLRDEQINLDATRLKQQEAIIGLIGDETSRSELNLTYSKRSVEIEQRKLDSIIKQREDSLKITNIAERHKSIEALNQQIEEQKLLKEFKSEKFLVSHNSGYNAFYLVSGGSDLITENEEIEIDGKVTTSKLKNAFMKFNKKKAINRVLVSKFIQGIAA